MPAPSSIEIRNRLSAFAAQWKNASRERGESQLFWARFYECYGIRPESATIYEKAVSKLDGAPGFIDSFIPGKLIVEHKSRGESLETAFDQAADYFLGLTEDERPRYIIVSDFARFRLYDLRVDQRYDCVLKDLPKHANWFRFLIDEQVRAITEESPINRKAAYEVSKLHEALLRANFRGRHLEIFLTRLLFCLFADDTGIFGDNGQFLRLIKATREDGRDTGERIASLFDVLDTPYDQRPSTLDDEMAAFAYVNGNLFSERTRIPAFNKDMRELLVRCSELDWSEISPAIFGAMFQGVLEAHTPDESRQASRRELGAHYTSERNILRVIEPLFLDDLRAELEAARRSRPRLRALYDRLPTLTFLDPACGCGNFLVIAYRELRRLENEVIAALSPSFGGTLGLLDVSHLCRVRVSQFYGIEIDQAAAHIARVALWITDHQMNLEAAERFGNTRPTVPLEDTPHIHCDNALSTDWTKILPPERCSYVMGNPPYGGAKYQKPEQRAEMRAVCGRLKNWGLLDYVAAWYVKALEYIKTNPVIDVAFVSTNSITQGEQVAVLWPTMLQAGVKIRFAHRTFRWGNEGKGNAAVHCVVVGFGLKEPTRYTIFDYSGDIKGSGQRIDCKHINPYLVDAPDTVLSSRRSPLSPVPSMSFGSMPNDGGHLLLSESEASDLILKEPQAKQWVHRFLSSDEFINNESRWCIWLVGISPAELRAMPEIYKRVQKVQTRRLASKRIATQKLATAPYLFGEIRQPSGRYLAVPKTSSERRNYLPIAFLPGSVIAGSELFTVADATLYHFAILSSTMHNAWLRAVGGRLESRYRYSASIVYNNFPWPTEPSKPRRQIIESAAQAIIDARAAIPDATLADLYDPLTIPPELRKAHEANDRAVDSAYGYRGNKEDPARVSFLFGLYQQLTCLPVADRPKARGRKGKGTPIL